MDVGQHLTARKGQSRSHWDNFEMHSSRPKRCLGWSIPSALRGEKKKTEKTLCLNGWLSSEQVQYSESSSQHKILWDFTGWSAWTACVTLECTNKSIMSSSNISWTSVVYSPACSLEGFALLSLPLLTHRLLFEANLPSPCVWFQVRSQLITSETLLRTIWVRSTLTAPLS